ncbi:MAG: hypothetical protein QG610_992, partial [Euryarchaeota archaeon]|nr:hypothetical protein [Euryarchaeota archaeon]
MKVPESTFMPKKIEKENRDDFCLFFLKNFFNGA